VKKILVAALLGAAFTSPAPAAESYDIPVVLSLTGYGAFLGKEEQESLHLVEGVVNASGGVHGRPVHFVLHDDQSVAQTTVQIANQLISEHPAVIMGPNITADCAAIAPLMKNGPVNYCFAAAYHPPKGSYVFAAGVSTRAQMAAMVRYFRLKGLTRIALATSTDATGQDGDNSFAGVKAMAENAGVQLVEQVHFNINDVSVTAQIERIREAKAQAVIVWCVGSSFGTIMRGLTQGGLEIPVGTTSGNMTLAQMQQFAGFLPKQLFFVSPAWPAGASEKVKLPESVAAKQKDFYAAYKAAGVQPDEGALLSWDPAIIVTDALRLLPEGATAAQLRAELLQVKNQPGVGGTYDFVDKEPQNGLSISDILVSQWDAKASNWVPVSQLGGLPLE
jgi:branched-chain amino acid transport system substrate-binding protein